MASQIPGGHDTRKRVLVRLRLLLLALTPLHQAKQTEASREEADLRRFRNLVALAAAQTRRVARSFVESAAGSRRDPDWVSFIVG